MGHNQTDPDIHCGSSRKKREREKIMAVNFPDLIKDINKNTKEVQQTPNVINPKRHMPRHFNQPLETERKRKNPVISQREVTCYIQGILKRLLVDFLSKKVEVREQWTNIFKELKKKIKS